MGRGQKFTLVAMALTLIVVLVVLLVLVRDDAATFPLSVLPAPSPGTWVSGATVTATRTAIPPRADLVPTTKPLDRASPTPSRPDPAPEILLARRIDELTGDVGSIRGLPKQREIPLNFLSTDELLAYLRRLRGDVERRRLVERQWVLLAALDLLPALDQGFPTTVHTRAGHIVAFYDPAEAQLFIGPAGREDAVPDVSLVHQYAHALVDQHFGLAELTGDALSADVVRARDALAEGDAMAVLMMHSLGDLDPVNDAPDIEAMAEHLSQVELTDYEGYPTSRAMRDLFLFPYREGTHFVAALLQTGWWPAVNAAYLSPPVSTEQVLHPEKYGGASPDLPRTVLLPGMREELGEGWDLVVQDVIGELVLRAHLDQYLPDSSEAVAAAAGWDGDLAAVWQDLEGRQVLVMRILWDSAEEADEFVSSYITLIDRRLRGARRIVRPILPLYGRWWRGPQGDVYVERQGNDVLVIWAPDAEILERALAVFIPEE